MEGHGGTAMEGQTELPLLQMPASAKAILGVRSRAEWFPGICNPNGKTRMTRSCGVCAAIFCAIEGQNPGSRPMTKTDTTYVRLGSMMVRPFTWEKWRRLNVARVLPRCKAVAATIRS
jgi:hypothetical protein